MRATVLGSSGFIGSRLAARLKSNGGDCYTPSRGSAELFDRDLGTVFYCIGMTADFRSRLMDTIDSHVVTLWQILKKCRFDRLVYLSSTRVYARSEKGDERERLSVSSVDSDDVYNLSKLMGESMTLAAGRNCCVARLSNVVGPGMDSTNFIGSVIEEARGTGRVLLRTSLESAKDYLWVDDAVDGLIAIASRGKSEIYNLAGGTNVSNAEFAKLLEERNIAVSVVPDAPTVIFPEISVNRLIADTEFQPKPFLPLMSKWIDLELGCALSQHDG
jgi:nucleoside-diphosphate-sugar epimerase